jgi:NAD(P)-dependent dehydrogenase (short-subunit alcohol dehydrogenase family)
MDLGLDGQVAFVGGASKGLGRATALVLAREGMRLSLAARDSNALEETAALAREAGAPEVLTWRVDLTDRDRLRFAIGGTCEQLGTIDCLVNNVGGPERGLAANGFLDFDDDVWYRAFDTVTLIAVRTCREVIPVMLANRRGSIVNVLGSAVRGHIPSMGQHESQKAAMAHVTKSLAKEFAPTIRVNAVLPGAMTDEQHRRKVLEPALAERGISEAELVADMNQRMYELTWSQRYGETGEVANVIAFLLSEKASYVSGAWVNVDGGSGPG